MQPQPRARVPAILVLQDPDFRKIWSASTLVETSRRMEQLVLSWFILVESESVFQLALVWVFLYLPRLMLSLLSGVIADRFNRKRVLMAAECLNVLTASGVLFLLADGRLQPWHVFAVISLQGTAWVLEQPSRRTAIFDIVGRQRLINAMSLDSISNTSGRLVGPILGGVIISLVGFTEAYGLALIFHLVALGILVRVTIPHDRSRASLGPVWSSLTASIRYAVHSPTLRALLYVTFVMNALVFPVQQFVPAIGKSHLGVGAALVGVLVAAEGIGQVAMAGVIASMRSHRYHGRVFLAGALTVVAMAALYVWSPWYALTFFFLTISGMGIAGFGTMQNSIAMLSSPQEIRGRMMGLLNLCVGFSSPLGALQIGLVSVALTTGGAISISALKGAVSTSALQTAISFSALTALLLLLPAVALTPLVRQRSTEPS